MKTNDNEHSHSGIGFMDALQIAFIVLKLIGKIEWSWLCVLIPLWIEILGAIIVAADVKKR